MIGVELLRSIEQRIVDINRHDIQLLFKCFGKDVQRFVVLSHKNRAGTLADCLSASSFASRHEGFPVNAVFGKLSRRFYSGYVSRLADIPNFAKIRTVFLDRDGVINEKAPEGEYVFSVAELHLLPGVPESIARLNRAGLRTIVVSNQRGIAKGLYTVQDVEEIHKFIQQSLLKQGARLNAFFICPHDTDECECRKPMPGMFQQAVQAFSEVRADESVMIGDSFVDIEFGRRLGMPTILIEGSPERHKPDLVEAIRLADWRVSSLPEAVGLLLNGRG